MGVRWGIEGTPENLLFMHSKLPSNALWSVLGVQKAQLPMITMGMLLGGHVRVGFEDNIYLKKGVLAKSNAEVVKNTASLAEKLGRSVATPKEAREILGLNPS
jgi:3-keto-5-aminohexanoate cleavage enzyme